jgi:hypothetical protein
LIERINTLTPETKAKWGKMNVSQMLAHCCVTYEMVYENRHEKPGFILGLILKWFVKNHVVNEKGYRQNLRTAPSFIIADEKEFISEKTRLINYLVRAQKDGIDFFNGKESHSFGKFKGIEWNNMFYKHINHHLTQFGV